MITSLTSLLTSLLMGTAAVGLSASAQAGRANDNSTRWLKGEVDESTSATLQVASRLYRPAAPSGNEPLGDGPVPEVWLIGVTHIGDASFYQEIEALTGQSDLILYESVMPEVTLPPTGDTPEARRLATAAALEWLASSAAACGSGSGTIPESMEALQVCMGAMDRRLVDAVRGLGRDAWGGPVTLIQNGNATFVQSLGADGEPGGELDDADLRIEVEIKPQAAEFDGIQQALASALGLEFQLTVLPYELAHWRVSDMSWEQLEARFEAEGVDLEAISGLLSGSSLPGAVAKMLLRMLPLLDMVTGGGVTDGVKVMLVEMLGREEVLSMALKQIGEAAGRILIDERNDQVLDDLDALTGANEIPERVAILYGAGHMADLHRKLLQRGYVVEETRWLPAITVDLKASALSPMHLRMLRRSIDMALKRIEAGR